MRIITLNLNGIRSAERKGFFNWLDQTGEEILVAERAQARARIVGAIAKEVKP